MPVRGLPEEGLHGKKIRLPEKHEGEQHQDHGRGALADAAQRAAEGLVKAHEEIKRSLQG